MTVSGFQFSVERIWGGQLASIDLGHFPFNDSLQNKTFNNLMVSERIVQAAADALYGKACTTSSGTSKTRLEHALPKPDLYDELLKSFDVGEIESAILWMKLRGYLSAFGWGLAPEMGYQLTGKGIKYAESKVVPKVVPEEDIKRLSEKPLSYKQSIFGFNINYKELWWQIKKLFFSSRKVS